MIQQPSIEVVEFFESWQGEGPNQGCLATFIRFKDCNLNCPFCDTKTLIQSKEPFVLDTNELLISLIKTKYLVITGGEPTLPKYQSQIIDLCKLLSEMQGLTVGIETNGSYLLDLLTKLDTHVKSFSFNLDIYWSPKTVKDDSKAQLFPNTKAFFVQTLNNVVRYTRKRDNVSIYVKVVADEYIDYDYVLACSNNVLPRHNIYVMPQGTTRKEIFDNCVKVRDIARKHGVNISTRAHILGLFD